MQGGVQEHALRSALRSKDVAASRWGWVVHSSEGAQRGEALKRATARLKRTWPRTILRSAVLVSFTQQKGSANAPSHAVIPASQRRIDQLSARDRHAKSPGGQRSGYCTRSQYFSQDRSKHVLKNHHNGRLSSGGEGG